MMANDNYKDRNMDNDRDKDNYRNNDNDSYNTNGSDQENGSQFSDQYHGNNNDNYKVFSAISQDNPEEGPEGGQSRASPPSK